MLTRELARTGVFVPEVGLGTAKYVGGAALLRRGMDEGALLIDTAATYGTEAVVGQAIRGMRDRVFVATKVPSGSCRRADLRKTVDASLRQLGVDTIDLEQLHGPNPSIPIAETMGALGELVDEGKVRFVGVSNFSLAELRAAQEASPRHPIVSNQVRYNIIDRTIEKDLLSYCQQNHILVIAYSPLARGLARIRDCDPRGAVGELARRTGRSPAQIAINWCLCKEGVITIPRGNSEQHILENCGASGWRLSADQIAFLDENILYRRRGRFGVMLRRSVPWRFRGLAQRAVERLPRTLRRRIT